MDFDKEKIIQSALDDEVINIDKLLECNDYETIKKGLTDYPLTIDEYLIGLYSEKDLRKIFEYAVDHELDLVANWCMDPSNVCDLESLVNKDLDNKRRYGSKLINDKYFLATRNDGFQFATKPPRKREDVVDTILKEMANKIDKQTITGDITNEYLLKLLEEDNFELLIIKLCVRLEAILRCDFHYDGTFEEMLSKYTSSNTYYDDNTEAYLEAASNEILHKLRKARNDIVHAQKSGSTMTKDELKETIEIVCKLG